MLSLVLLLGLIIALVGMRSVIQKNIQAAVMLFGGSRYQGILLYSLIFLPGIMVHEMSHFFAATILGVRTGEIHLLPSRDSQKDGRIALGTVRVAKTDFVRASLIGAAPFFAGTILLFFLVSVLVDPEYGKLGLISWDNLFEVVTAFFKNARNLLLLYFVFTIANTMFASKEDTRAFPVLLVFLVIVVGILVITNNWYRLVEVFWPKVEASITVLTGSFLAAVMIDLVVVLSLVVFVQLMQRITKKRVVYGK